MKVNSKKSPSSAFKTVPELIWVDRISKIMDSKFTIPGTKIKFGLDPVLSLFPVLGSLSTYFISGILILIMVRKGASGELAVKMTFNATLDAIMSTIPVLGTIFDVVYKANNRNVRLLNQHYLEGKHRGSGKGTVALIIIVFIIIVVALFYLAWIILAELITLIQGWF